MTDSGKRIRGLMKKAQDDLSFADFMLARSPEQAARMAYMAAFHAALAAVLSVTGKEPKTHRGVRLTFGELILNEKGFSRDLGNFVASAYESKDIADYQTEYEVDSESAKKVMAGAREVVRQVTVFLAID